MKAICWNMAGTCMWICTRTYCASHLSQRMAYPQPATLAQHSGRDTAIPHNTRSCSCLQKAT